MSDPIKNPWSRRMFIQQGVTLASLAATTPLFIQQTAKGVMLPQGSGLTSIPGMPQDRILVIVQLGGGNDGLNTVVPYGSPDYYRLRPGLGIAAPGRNAEAALQLSQGQGIGLHPAMAGLKSLMDDGVASIVQGVGYPNPNRSHFSSMDIWHTASPDGRRGSGWVGRYFDNECAGAPNPEIGIAVGREAPLAMQGDTVMPVSFESADLYRWMGEDLDKQLSDPYSKIADDQQDQEAVDQLSFLKRTTMDAQISSKKVRHAVSQQPLVAYPGGNLSNQLQMIAAMIRSEMPTRVYYATMGGFDTHANQAGQHTRLLQQVGDSLKSFYGDIKAQGNSGRVLTMVFSEFGRRVAQNASGGTDHGTAAPMYFVGDMINPGLHGTHPSLTNLDGGDLKFTQDFRSVYAGVLGDWMATDSGQVLGRKWKSAPVIKTS
ncbi:MAG: DUF1501 domain-containing protein [Phycisphaerales bacterium]|nr:DUF1501 domain-containing protein [Phycisphaerales bacterium]